MAVRERDLIAARAKRRMQSQCDTENRRCHCSTCEAGIQRDAAEAARDREERRGPSPAAIAGWYKPGGGGRRPG